MLVTSLRSSSIGTLSMCELKYYFTYVLGFQDKQNKAALLGTIFHRAMQVLADKKIAITANKKTVDFEGKRLKLEKCDDISYITKLSLDHYQEHHPNILLTGKDLDKCISWVNEALSYNDGALDPRNQEVYATEQFFDFEVDKDWAKYEFDVNGEKLSGKLRIRGTIDLILNVADNHYQVLDYKSGQRKNWATGKKKEYDDLEYDSQLLLYYFALKNLYPDAEFDVSIFYVNDGGLFCFPYEEKHYKLAENMLRQKFEYIKNVQIPRQVSTNPDHPTCKYMCAFSAMKQDSDKTICQHFFDDIKKNGIQTVTDNHIDLDSIAKYTGGGRIAK